ncbi:hypothetical protein ABIB17_003794 [Arthrobacter sp. UYEF6]
MRLEGWHLIIIVLALVSFCPEVLMLARAYSVQPYRYGEFSGSCGCLRPSVSWERAVNTG